MQPIDIDGAAIVDPVRDLLLYVDPRGSQKLFAFDLKDPDATSVELGMSGNLGILSRPKFGFEWDPLQRRAVAWDDGADLYVLEAPAGDWKTGTWRWTRVPPAATNTVVPVRGVNGTYSRFRYVPSVNAFVVVSSTSGPVWMVRMSEDLGPGPNPQAGSGGWAAPFALLSALGLARLLRRRPGRIAS